MLSHLRVIDLTSGSEQIAGQMLGDLGADVILVEPPSGSGSRFAGPYVNDVPDPNRSLNFWSWNRNKRGVTADIETEAGRERIRRLIRNADIVLESFEPGRLDALGLGYEALAAINPRVVLTSITPFGATGPRANWVASDLTVLASSCVLQITGDEDRAPCRVAVPQAFLHAGADAAAGSLLAYVAAQRDGVGQHVDVSAQASTAMATQAFILAAAWDSTEITRLAGGLALGPLTLKLVNPAKDGYVSVTFLFGTAIGPFSRRLMEVMCEEGFVDEATRDKDWVGYMQLLLAGQEPVSELLRCQKHIAEFTAAHTKAELAELAMARGLLIVPVATIDDIARSSQLAAREYWVEMEHPELGRTYVYPGPFAKLSATPLVHRLRPPLLGEHDAEVAATVEQEPPRPAVTVTSGTRARPLEGVKVLDLMWVMAGPAATRYLADFGATVVRVESTVYVDTARTLQPFPKNVPGPNNSGLFATMNAGKLGLTINPANRGARETIERLVRWADVVTESFAVGATARMGIDYESLKAINPSIIMVSSCLNGQTGPMAQLAGFGTMGAQLAGFGEMAGWPDRPPAGPFGAYTDYVAPKFTVAAIVAALEHRRLTGEGQYIDLSQGEASLHFLAPAFLDYAVNGRVMKRNGNASPEWAPHGVFPAQGEDRWVAIACETEEQWTALCSATGHPEWSTDPRFATLEGRHLNREALEATIGEWTAQRTQAGIEEVLQAAGVPVAASQRSSDALADPQLAHREYFKWVEHPEHGRVAVENTRFILSATPGKVERPGPVFGQDNEYVLREILGLSDDEVTELIVAGALE